MAHVQHADPARDGRHDKFAVGRHSYHQWRDERVPGLGRGNECSAEPGELQPQYRGVHGVREDDHCARVPLHGQLVVGRARPAGREQFSRVLHVHGHVSHGAACGGVLAAVPRQRVSA